MTPNYLKEAEEWISKECPIEYGQSKEAQRVRLFATHLSKKYGKEEKIDGIKGLYEVIKDAWLYNSIEEKDATLRTIIKLLENKLEAFNKR